MSETIYKILQAEIWIKAKAKGKFCGAAIDLKDGYIHFSTLDQVAETLRLHFAGVERLLLLTVEADRFGDELKWEPSRGGDLFPHLYADLPVECVTAVDELLVDRDGVHQLPELQ